MRRKVKVIARRILVIIGRISGYLDVALTWWIGNLVAEYGGKYHNVAFLFYALAIFWLYRALRFEWLVFKSKRILLSDCYNSRVMGFEGGQGRGKTSLMLYVASLLKAPCYSNVPFYIRGHYTYILDKDHLKLKKRLKEGSVLLLDEITLYYNNQLKDDTYGFELLLQLIRHFTDGYVLMASIAMGRIPKALEEKVMQFKHLLGQETVYNSYMVLPLVRLIDWAFKLDGHYGLRIWHYQTFESIDHPGYYFDLSRQESDTNDVNYANLTDIYAWNNALRYDYLDRFMLGIYMSVPAVQDEVRYHSLVFDKEILLSCGFGEVVKYLQYTFSDPKGLLKGARPKNM